MQPNLTHTYFQCILFILASPADSRLAFWHHHWHFVISSVGFLQKTHIFMTFMSHYLNVLWPYCLMTFLSHDLRFYDLIFCDLNVSYLNVRDLSVHDLNVSYLIVHDLKIYDLIFCDLNVSYLNIYDLTVYDLNVSYLFVCDIIFHDLNFDIKGKFLREKCS